MRTVVSKTMLFYNIHPPPPQGRERANSAKKMSTYVKNLNCFISKLSLYPAFHNVMNIPEVEQANRCPFCWGGGGGVVLCTVHENHDSRELKKAFYESRLIDPDVVYFRVSASAFCIMKIIIDLLIISHYMSQ